MDEDFYYYMDGRNARRPARPPGSAPITRFVIPPSSTPLAPAPVAQPTAMAPTPQALPPQPMPAAPPPYAMGYPGPMAPSPYASSPYGFTPPPYGMPPMYYGMYNETPSVLQAMFGKITLGQLVELGTQVYAAAQKLPTAPTAVPDVGDNFANLITYQSALASHAKRDEQVRTLGALIGKLVG
jgi:hypothetical protein